MGSWERGTAGTVAIEQAHAEANNPDGLYIGGTLAIVTTHTPTMLSLWTAALGIGILLVLRRWLEFREAVKSVGYVSSSLPWIYGSRQCGVATTQVSERY